MPWWRTKAERGKLFDGPNDWESKPYSMPPAFITTGRTAFFSRAKVKPANRRINQRKDAEIGLADQVLTVSEFARESYLEAGVASDRVHAIPVGVDTGIFRPNAGLAETTPRNHRDFRFVYLGKLSRLKGFDVLHEAVGRLRAAGDNFTMTLIGPPRTASGDQPADGMVRKRLDEPRSAGRRNAAA